MHNRKKVLIIANQSGFLFKFEMDDVHILQSMGYEVHYAANADDKGYYYDMDILKKEGIIFHHVKIARSPYMLKMNISALRQIKRIIKENKINLIHCHTPVGGVLGRLAPVLCCKNKPKVIYTAHGFHFYKGAPLINNIAYQAVERFLALFTDTLILINKEDYLKAKRFLLRKKTEVYQIPGIGLDLDMFTPVTFEEKRGAREGLGIGENEYFVLSVGEMNENKNHRTVIEAIKKIKEKSLVDKDIVYGICGDGFFREDIEQYVQKNSELEGVRFYGYQCDIKEYYAAADLTVFPSKREGLGMAGLESLAMGIPVIAADNRGTREYMKDTVNGYVCKADDVDGFINGIVSVLKMPRNEKDEMVQNCINSVGDFSKDITADLMKKIYESADKKVKIDE
ncbi:MAG: glycosyltransferase family 4 protein [Clostridia bacterium]|nr:glycosyltransferase family 4 protein [Clostridia bacterium]